MTARTDRQETFCPLQDKTLTNTLRQVFATEFGYEHKMLFADAMIERILETVDAFVRPTTMVRPGQMVWLAVANDGHKHAHQEMKDIPQVPVVLDLTTEEELTALARGEPFAQVRDQRCARLLDQAFAQDGVLAQGDLAAILLTPRCQVGRAIGRFREEKHRILPFRGSVQDVGGTLTHKVEVIRLLEAGYLEPDICRRLSVKHDLESVERYVQAYKNVQKLLARDFAPEEVSGILHMDERLVNAYIDIIREHHPDILANNSHLRAQAGSPASSSPGAKSP